MTGLSQMQKVRYSSRFVGECTLHSTSSAVRKLVLVATALMLVFIQTSQAAGNSSSSSPQEQEKIGEFDRVIQGYAFKAFRHPKTGIVVNVNTPSSMQGVLGVQAVRLRSGSLRRRGLSFNELSIPDGSGVPNQAPLRVVLVYRQFTAKLYSPEGYTIVSPVVGIRVYDAFNLSTDKDLAELEFVTDGFKNISIQVPLGSILTGVTPVCAAFDAKGSMSLSNLTSMPSTCSSNSLADFALVVPSGLLPPAPAPSAVVLPPPPPPASPRKKKRSRRWRVVLGAVLGAFAALLLLLLLLLAALRLSHRRRISTMERKAERGEALQSSLVRSSRAPTAGATRTKPVLEGDYAVA